MITVGEVESLSEAQCKAVIDVLVKQAYGEHAEIYINNDRFAYNGRFAYNVMLKIENMHYYLFGFDKHDFSTICIENSCEDFTWKNLLNQLENFAQKPNAYVSYLESKPHLIDNNTSIEEIIINLDLMRVE